MAFCSNCGTKLDEGARFCPSCGTPVAVAAPAAPAAAAPTVAAPVAAAPAQAGEPDLSEHGIIRVIPVGKKLVIPGYGDEGVFIKDREVTLSPYSIGKFPVTWELWNFVRDWPLLKGYQHTEGQCGGSMVVGKEGNTFSAAAGEQQPVTEINWFDAVVWCNAYSEMLDMDPVYRIGRFKWAHNETEAQSVEWDRSKHGFRLPTEAEWECAARGGNPNIPAWEYKYAGSDDPDEVAWHYANSGNTSHPVGQKKPNSLGLYDMSGNVEEWCWDWYTETISVGSAVNPDGGTATKAVDWAVTRVTRGGFFGWTGLDLVQAVAERYNDYNDTPYSRYCSRHLFPGVRGFRVVYS